ncbi:M23 family metallopeptidase [soil metagenome]
MRFFPSAARQQVAAVLVGLVSLAAFAIPLAHADDDGGLKQRQKHVKGQIDRSGADLEEASGAATRARRSYDAALGRLEAARAHLTDVSTRLESARERDAALRQALAEAEQRLTEADARLASGQAATVDAKEQARVAVLRSADDGDLTLRAIGSFVNAASFDDLTRQIAAQTVVLHAGGSAYSTYRLSESALSSQAAQVATAKEDVEARRVEAAEHLLAVRKLYDRAKAAKADVAELVVSTRSAKQQALQAKQHDRARLAALKQREDRIHDQLVELARKAKARAAAAAAEAARSGATSGGGGYRGSSAGYLSYPANGPVTSPFGYRIHPIYGYYGLHNGTDFGVSCGQSLLAAATGTVIDTYYDSVYGNRLYLNVGIVNGKSLVLIYNHMSGYRAHEGERVTRGQTVGYAGSTGWSTGCHLHFTVMADGVAVDPMTYL